MYLLHCLPLLRLIYYENHMFLLLLRSWYTFHMEKPLVSWWEQRHTHDIQAIAFSYKRITFTALQSDLRQVLDIPPVGFGRPHPRRAIPDKTRTC